MNWTQTPVSVLLETCSCGAQLRSSALSQSAQKLERESFRETHTECRKCPVPTKDEQ